MTDQWPPDVPDGFIDRVEAPRPSGRIGDWTIQTERTGFDHLRPEAIIPQTVEGHALDTIYISGPGTRSLVVAIELGEPGEPVRVRVTEDGYGFRRTADGRPDAKPDLYGIVPLRWVSASDGGEAVELPISRTDMEER